jgi:hypothetical protein
LRHTVTKTFLEHVLGFASVIQDTQANAKKLRGGILVNHPQRGPIATRNPRERGNKLTAANLYIHWAAYFPRTTSL